MKRFILSIVLMAACAVTFHGCAKHTSSDKKNEKSSGSAEKTGSASDGTQKISKDEYCLGSIKYRAFQGYDYTEGEINKHLHTKSIGDSANILDVAGYYYDTSTSKDEMITYINEQRFSNWNWTMKEEKTEMINNISFTISTWSMEDTPLPGSIAEKNKLNRVYSASFFNDNNMYCSSLLFRDDSCSYEDFLNILKTIELSDPSKNLTRASAFASSSDRDDFRTGITYDNLARNPDEYQNKLVTFTGTVIQVVESDTEVQLRIAVDHDYDQIIYCCYEPSIADERIVENDTITIYGASVGMVSYESTMGSQVSIPGVFVQMLDQ